MEWEGLGWIHLAVLVAGCCEQSNEPTAPIKGGEFLD